MNLADKIRDLSQHVEPKDIAETLSIPLDLVESVLNGTVDEEELAKYDPSMAIKVIERQVVNRGRVISVLQNPALAAEIALYVSNHNSVAAIDLQQFPVLPLYFGMNIEDIPQYTNVLWDEYSDKKPYKDNMYIYFMPPRGRKLSLISSVLNSFPTVVVNTPLELLDMACGLSDVVYLPVMQNLAGVHFVRQLLTQYKNMEEKIQIIWVTNQNIQYASILRQFTTAKIAGHIPDLQIDINSGKYQKLIAKILQPLYPEKRKLFGVF